MTASRRLIAGLFAYALFTSGPRLAVADSTDPLHWHEPWLQPHDPGAAVTRSDEYAWRLFVAVNWPADTIARTADSKVQFGADRPSVWESWRNSVDVYLQNGQDPGPWVSRAAAALIADERRFEASSLKELPNVRHIVGGRMVSLTDPIGNAKRLTEIRMNRAAFNYIRARELYSLDGQLKFLAQRRPVRFPAASTEVKAQWRPIRADERSHYHCVKVRLADGTTRLYGLTALHIVTKDLPNWFWATFEQVDNPSLPDADGWQLPSSDRFACASDRVDCNRAPAAIGLEGTVWQFYRLRGTLTRFVDVRGEPLLLANSELEAGMQRSASCITCHSRASIGMVAGAPARLPIFDSTSEGSVPEIIVRRGFVGQPRSEWFENAAGEVGARPPSFQPLDFVWSLSKAQPKRSLK